MLVLSGNFFSMYFLNFYFFHIPNIVLGFPGGSADKESACNAGDLGSIPGLGKSSGEANGYLLQYSGLENSIDYICISVDLLFILAWLIFKNYFKNWLADITFSCMDDNNYLLIFQMFMEFSKSFYYK